LGAISDVNPLQQDGESDDFAQQHEAFSGATSTREKTKQGDALSADAEARMDAVLRSIELGSSAVTGLPSRRTPNASPAAQGSNQDSIRQPGVLQAITREATEAAQPLGAPSEPVQPVCLDKGLPQVAQISASDAIFDILRDYGTPKEHQLRSAHRSVFDIDAEGVAREEKQVCMYMRPVHVWLLRGALGLVTDEKNKKLLEIFSTLPDAEQDNLLGLVETFAARAAERSVALARQNQALSYTPPPLPPAGSGYKTLPARVRMSAEEVIAFAKEVWGPWLKSCHPSLVCDAMTRQDLLKRDARLYNRLQALREVDALGQVFQTRDERLNARADLEALEAAATGDHRKMRTIAGRLAMRAHRAKKTRSIPADGPFVTESSPEPT
jgi:hypothetical protein